MHNFSKIRKISGGDKLSLPETITLSDNIKTDIIKSSADTYWLNKLLEGNKNNNGSTDPYMYKGISQGISVVGNMAANTVNLNMYRAEEYDKFGLLMSGLSSIPGLLYLGLAKSGVDLITAGLSSLLGNVNIDQGTIERIGGGYSGSVANINRAKQISGKNAIGKSHREGVDVINRANTQMKTMLNIDIDNQTRQALAANTLLNNLRYGQTLNSDFDPRFISIGKNGIKLEYIDRVKHLKIKQIVNVNTKQVEEFKNGGSIGEEFTPTIIEEPWIPEIVLDVFKDGGKTNKKSKSRTIEELIEYAKELNPRFILRMSEPLRYIRINIKDEDGKESWSHATHEMNYRGNEVFPMVQEINDKLYLFESEDDAYDNAKKTNNILTFNSEDEAKLFAVSGKDKDDKLFGYKLGWLDFFELSPVGIKEEYSVNRFKDGGKTEESELVKLEETTLKNVIPEGALHKNKHHIKNTEGLTLKGIPVIDNGGEQLAEIELNEIIFTLEVTKKLEELHKLYKESSNKERDEAAIEAGKLLVQEILYNTDDRTDLIAKCEKGGKLNENVE